LPEGGRPEPKLLRRQAIGLLEAELAADGYDLLDVRVFQGGGRTQIRVYVDRLAAEDSSGPGAAAGISLDEVARASRTVEMLLEEADLFADRYVIEVSSPGIRRPLRTVEHFRRAVGEKVDLKTVGAGRVRGRLRDLDGETLVVATAEGADEGEPGPTERVPLEKLAEANLDPEFDVQAIINADRRERKESKRLQRARRKGRKKSRPRARKKDDAG
jgi:ribosome maturation factor RimP